MICEACDLRSSIGFCSSCKRMLCNECSEACNECGKLVCKKHAFDGPGMVYCRACGKEHGARPRSPEAVVVGEAVEEKSVRRPYENPPAWQVAAMLSGLAMVFTGLLYLYPGFVRLPVPGGISLPIALAVPLVPMAAIGWAIGGFRESKHPRRPLWCLASVVISVLSMAGAFLAF